MTGNHIPYANPRRFTSQTKAQIVIAARHLSAQRTEDAARAKHLLICRNGLSDEELKAWKAQPKVVAWMERLLGERAAA
jgi:hypothetical protein